MKRKVLAIASLLVVINACAEESQNAKPFLAESTLSNLLEKIPSSPMVVSWLPEATVVRYNDSRFDKEKSMPAVRELYEQWCKAKLGKIYQPRNGNCTFLRNGLGCAVGELQQIGLGTDFERGIKDAATGSGDTVPGFSIQVVEGGSSYTQICTYGFRFQQGIVSYRTLAARAETREGGVYAGNATAWKSVSAPSALVRETATRAAGSPDLVQNQVQEIAAFLDFPLKCGDNACAFKYTKGAYTPASVNSVLDHHLTTPYTNEDGVVNGL